MTKIFSLLLLLISFGLVFTTQYRQTNNDVYATITEIESQLKDCEDDKLHTCERETLICSTSSASQNPVTVIQPDGSLLNIIGKGDININYTETLDGYTIVKDEKGFYQYAVSDLSGNLIVAGTIAKNLSDRNFRDFKVLNGIPKHLRYTGATLDKKQAKVDVETARASQNAPQESFPITGAQKVLTILIKYPDLDSTYSVNNFDSLMNVQNYNGTGSFRDYYIDNSFNQLILNTDVYGWYTADSSFEYYGNQHGKDRARELAGEALDAAEAAGVDFSEYDNDNDGEVDGVIFVHSGPGAEEGSQEQYIWSHRSVLYGSYQRIYDGVTIRDYMFNPETRDGLTDPTMVGIGIFCHEFGHGLGLPDIYDTNSSNGSSAGVGVWCLMGSGNWLNSEDTPAGLSAWCKAQLNWINPVTVTSGQFTLPPATSNASCFRIDTPDPLEYFLIENRHDSGWDDFLPGHGLAIWHIDDNQSGNGDEDHKLVDLEEADGLNQLDLNLNRGDTGDLYPGSSNNTTFNGSSNPNSNLYNTQDSGICIENIQVSGTNASFELGCPPPCVNVISSFGFNNLSASTIEFVSTSSNETDYSWTFGDGETSTLQNPTHTYMLDGNYTVCLTVSNDCSSNSICSTITINGVCPATDHLTVNISGTEYHEVSAVLTAENTVFSGANATYDAGDNICLQPGFHAISGAAFHAKIEGCTASKTSQIEDKVSVSLDKISIQNYPNPFSEFTTFEFEIPEQTYVQMDIYDLTGKVIARMINNELLDGGKHNIDFNAQNLNKGIYICRLSTDNEVATHKLVIE